MDEEFVIESGVSAMYRFLVAATVLAGIALAATSTSADTLRLKNGREFEGHVISQNSSQVVFESGSGPQSVRQRIPTALIDELVIVERTGLNFAVIPVVGRIGFDPESDQFTTAIGIRKSIDEASEANPDVVIIDINSPGGSIEEMGTIISEIDQLKSRKVAWVRDALSASAVIAMTCPEIVMAPSGRVGAAVPYRVGPDGTPTTIEEKWQSAIRASFRRAAVAGGHSDLLIRGMMDPDIELVIDRSSGGPRVKLLSDASSAELLKSRGQILTLTAKEAVDCGLATGIAEDLDELRNVLGIEAWYESTSRSRYAVGKQARAETRMYEQEKLLEEQRIRRQMLIARYGPELEDINEQIRVVDGEISANERALDDLYRQRSRAVTAVERQHEANLRIAYSSYDSASVAAEAQAIYQSEIGDIIRRFDPLIAVVERDLNTARATYEILVLRQRDILEVLEAD